MKNIKYESKHWDSAETDESHILDSFNHPREYGSRTWENHWSDHAPFDYITLVTVSCIYCQLINIRRILWEINKNG